MKKEEALYQLKQNIKMHEIEGTTSNQNEREKALLDYITNLQEENKELLKKSYSDDVRITKAVEYIKRNYKVLLLTNPPQEAFNKDELLNILNGDKDE